MTIQISRLYDLCLVLFIYTGVVFSAPLVPSKASTTAPSKESSTAPSTTEPPPLKHAISLYGQPKYGPDFTHFGFVRPDAPKGGELRQGVIGHFDSLIPYIDRGTAAAGSHLMFDSLLARSWDEPLTKYGLIAEKIELDPNNNWVAFQVNSKARFHDGKPVTAKDVKFSFDLLREKGSTFYKHFYREIERVEVTSTYRVLFVFNTNYNRELPLILGQMPILPEHYWKDRDFSSPGLEVPVSSGPYRAIKIDAGRSVAFARVKDYWARDLPSQKGRHNFDLIRYEYYRDRNVLLEALQKGTFDLKTISDPKEWFDQIKDKALAKNDLIRTTIRNHNPQTLTLTYNTRRPLLADVRVRQALGYTVDFERINQRQYHSMFARASSYFAGTDLAASGIPTLNEAKLLEPWRNALPPALFNQPWTPPGAESGLTSRERKRKALELLQQAGWRIKNNRQVNANGKPLELEALLSTAEQERIMLPVKKQLESFGIQLNLRTVDIAQYVERTRSLDFDLILYTYPHTASPGTEQASLWGSQTVDNHGTRNLAGVRLPVIDHLTEIIPEANSRQELLTRVHAMDRVLLWNHYSLPLWYQPAWSIIHKRQLRYPDNPAPYALDISTWWYQPD